ncbi:bacterioferritin [Ferrimonas marina]|uniref:Bacterioferritin n=1 Tax=Ferrimonas marina TaxID=299255 RepID=A0A1M5X729_9GAMM|nr:bacterioferritin [Ferrimonas marina]SHH95452.1 bacterioferritin [Ferrimonas marina]
MQGNPQVIASLNAVLTHQLTAINQYFLHARMAKNWGLSKLNDAEYKKSIREMKYADALIERILFLEGLPNLQKLGHLKIAETPEELLVCDRAFQQEQIDVMREAAAISERAEDYVSRALINGQLEQEEEQLDWLDTQLQLLEQLGSENYLQAQL